MTKILSDTNGVEIPIENMKLRNKHIDQRGKLKIARDYAEELRAVEINRISNALVEYLGLCTNKKKVSEKE